MPERRPVRTMNPTTALTSSLRHAAVVNSGSSSTVISVPPSSSASGSAASPSGSTSRAPVRSRTQPPGSGSAEIHTVAGTTCEAGHSGPTRSTCSTPFCSAHTTVRSSHSRASHPAASSFWVSLTASRHHVYGTVDLGGIRVHRTRHHDRLPVVGPDLDLIARRAPAQQHVMTGRVQECRDGRADRAGADDRDAGESRLEPITSPSYRRFRSLYTVAVLSSGHSQGDS